MTGTSLIARNRGKLRNVTREALEPLWFNSRLTLDEIGAHLGVSRAAVRERAVRVLGLPPRGKACRKLCKDDELARMWLAGVHRDAIAAHFGYADGSAVSKWAHRMGLPHRSRDNGGWGGWGDRLTVAQYREQQMAEAMRVRKRREDVLRLAQSGLDSIQIAKRLGFAKSTIREDWAALRQEGRL